MPSRENEKTAMSASGVVRRLKSHRHWHKMPESMINYTPVHNLLVYRQHLSFKLPDVYYESPAAIHRHLGRSRCCWVSVSRS